MFFQEANVEAEMYDMLTVLKIIVVSIVGGLLWLSALDFIDRHR